MEKPLFSHSPSIGKFQKLYLHIPFCRSKCPYCAFYSEAASSRETRQEYITALGKELAWWTSRKGHPLKAETLYIGGGTPSTLEVSLWEQLFEKFDSTTVFTKDAEITVEANPESLDRERLNIWKEWGVSRISLGIQSFSDKELHMLERPHGEKEARKAVSMALEEGFAVSLDLIFGLPHQTLRGWHRNLHMAVAMGVEHISIYQLTLEEKTPWGTNPPKGISEGYPLYRWGQFYLPAKGLNQYEVASFARPGKESRHNLAYWRQEEVFGIGAGAWGYLKGIRYAHKKDIHNYIKAWNQHKGDMALLQSLHYEENLNLFQRAAEGAVLYLRTKWGIPVRTFRRHYGNEIALPLLRKLRPFIPELVVYVEGHLRFTPKGVRVANQIWSELL